MLIGKNISKSYGDRKVLTDINIRVKPGEIVAIIGPSGSGKSTLLRSLSLLDPPDSGSVIVDDNVYNFPKLGDDRVASPWPKLTLVFQQLFLWPHLTIRKNIELPLKCLDKNTREERIKSISRRLNLRDFIDRYPNQISVGQRQRAAIARAFSLEPSPTYFLLDEITSALDVEHINSVLDYLRELAANGKAIVLVTHLIGFAQKAANQVLFMENGKIIEDGTAEILMKPKMPRLRSFLSLIEATVDKGSTDGKAGEFFRSEYISRAVLASLREGDKPSKAEVSFLDRTPLVDELRKRVTDNDILWLNTLIGSDPDYVAGLACSLLKNFCENSDVIAQYENVWNSASPYLKNRILWRLVDNPAKAEEWHQRLVDFVFQEGSTFRDFNLGFFGEADQALASILDRLASAKEKPHKKWLYLCCIPEVVEDPKVARSVLEMGRLMAFPHMRETSDRLIAQYWLDENNCVGPVRASGYTESSDPGFLARAVVQCLRNGPRPSEDEADVLNRLPHIDWLREAVQESDVDAWLIPAISGDNDREYAGLCLSLLRKFDEQPEVQKFLKRRWNKASPFLKAHLLWRILDDPELSKEWHEIGFQFVMGHKDIFDQVSLKFLGSSEDVVEAARKRYEDPQFPASKKWAYLCRVAGIAKDNAEAQSFLEDAKQDSHAFTRQVAKELLQRYYGGEKGRDIS